MCTYVTYPDPYTLSSAPRVVEFATDHTRNADLAADNI